MAIDPGQHACAVMHFAHAGIDSCIDVVQQSKLGSLAETIVSHLHDITHSLNGFKLHVQLVPAHTTLDYLGNMTVLASNLPQSIGLDIGLQTARRCDCHFLRIL